MPPDRRHCPVGSDTVTYPLSPVFPFASWPIVPGHSLARAWLHTGMTHAGPEAFDRAPRYRRRGDTLRALKRDYFTFEIKHHPEGFQEVQSQQTLSVNSSSLDVR